MINNISEHNETPGRRAAAYWFADGLPEIVFGFLLLIPGALVLLLETLHLHWQNRWLAPGFIEAYLFFYLLGCAIWFLYRPILNYLKVRITYPRTGYVNPPNDFPDKKPDDNRIFTFGTARPADDNVSSFVRHMVPLIFSGVFLMGFLKSTYWGLPLVMIGISAGIYFLNRKEVRSYSLFAVLPIALAGFVAAALDLTPEMRWMATMVICSAWLLGIGIWTLFRYFRSHPKPDTKQEGCL
jgi:hypothetical protein